MTLRIGSLCSGYEGLGMGVQSVLGGELAFVADNDPGAAAILAYRYPGVPNLGDIADVAWDSDDAPDILCAGFPCQDVSCAGARVGLRQGTRSGVWAHVANAIGVLEPRLVVIENVRGLLSFGADSNVESCPWCLGEADLEHALRAAGAVLGDLADIGYDAVWRVVSADDAGFCHLRNRVIILAWPAQDTYGTTGDQWRLAAPGQAAGWRPWADAGGSGRARVAANAIGCAGPRGPAQPIRQANWGAPSVGDSPGPDDATPADTPGLGIQPVAGIHGGLAGTPGPDAAGRQWQTRLRHTPGTSGEGSGAAIDWRQYAAAIRRQERIFGRPAPRPTEPGRTGERLSPRFVEWMMGLPEGWVTDVPGLGTNDQVKALGNGCVPQQVALALSLLLPHVPAGALAFLHESERVA